MLGFTPETSLNTQSHSPDLEDPSACNRKRLNIFQKITKCNSRSSSLDN